MEGTRKAYERPAVCWEEQVEVRANLALGCGKIAGQVGQCNHAPTS